MVKFISFILVLLVTASFAEGQVVVTGPVDATMKVEWKLPTTMTVPEGLLFEPRLYDSMVPLPTKLTGFTCVDGTVTAPNPVCRVPLTPALVTQLNTIGKHTLTLTFFRTDVGESPLSVPFSLSSPSAAPINLQLIR